MTEGFNARWWWKNSACLKAQSTTETTGNPNNYCSCWGFLCNGAPQWLTYCWFLLAPGVSHPVQAVQLVVSQLQPIIYKRRLLLHGHKPGPLFQDLMQQTDHMSANNNRVSWRVTKPTDQHTDRQRGLAVPYLTVSGWNGLGLVSAHVVINAPLKLLGNQTSVLPAALRVWQTLPLTQVVWVPRSRLLVRMSCQQQAKSLPPPTPEAPDVLMKSE